MIDAQIIRAKNLYRIVDRRVGSQPLPLLSVSIHKGVVLRDEITDRPYRADELANYKVCLPGDIVVNRMRAFQGAVGISTLRGIVSPDYLVIRPAQQVEGRYLHHLFRSNWFVGEMISRLRGIGGIDSGSVRTPRINPEDLGSIPVPLPSLDEQRRIADFLDAETARIDAILSLRRARADLLAQAEIARIFDAVSGQSIVGSRKESGLRWLGEVPAQWPIAPVSAHFEVLLGKMLSSERISGDHLKPYLRNTNVQWDTIQTDDLLQMDFPPSERARYEVLPGDLLVCEGGDPGRAAIWTGEVPEVYYQKALHRIRKRSSSEPRWLFYCLRLASAMNAFAIEGNQTTIAHLTAEQLRAQRFPFPDPTQQRQVVSRLDRSGTRTSANRDALRKQEALLNERRQALITAAVTGQFDVATGRGADLS